MSFFSWVRRLFDPTPLPNAPYDSPYDTIYSPSELLKKYTHTIESQQSTIELLEQNYKLLKENYKAAKECIELLEERCKVLEETLESRSGYLDSRIDELVVPEAFGDLVGHRLERVIVFRMPKAPRLRIYLQIDDGRHYELWSNTPIEFLRDLDDCDIEAYVRNATKDNATILIDRHAEDPPTDQRQVSWIA